jgi:hypothetical protein
LTDETAETWDYTVAQANIEELSDNGDIGDVIDLGSKNVFIWSFDDEDNYYGTTAQSQQNELFLAFSAVTTLDTTDYSDDEAAGMKAALDAVTGTTLNDSVDTWENDGVLYAVDLDEFIDVSSGAYTVEESDVHGIDREALVYAPNNCLVDGAACDVHFIFPA